MNTIYLTYEIKCNNINDVINDLNISNNKMKLNVTI